MSKEQRMLVTTGLGQVHLRVHSGAARADAPLGGAPLVLLHMSPRSSQMWTYLQPLLDRQSIAPDRPGYGFSDSPAATPTFAGYAAAMWEALDASGVMVPSICSACIPARWRRLRWRCSSRRECGISA